MSHGLHPLNSLADSIRTGSSSLKCLLTGSSSVQVWVVQTNEELQIAREAAQVLNR